MKNKALALILGIGILLSVYALTPSMVSAYDYGLTVDPDPPVPQYTLVTATATTSDGSIDRVVFEWRDPSDVLRDTVIDNEPPYEDSYELDN